MTEPSGVHFVVITKNGSFLRMWLMEQTNPTTAVTQAEIDLNAPLVLVEPYLQAMTLALLWNPTPTTIYTTGLGGGRLPFILNHHLPDTAIYCAEIDPVVVTAATRYFGVQLDGRIQVALEDGREWLTQNQGPFDFIFLDVFLDNGYTPYRMATTEFYALCQERLTGNGVVAVNFLQNDPYYLEKIATIQDVFPHVYRCELPDENNVVFAARKSLEIGKDPTEVVNALMATHPFQFSLQPWADLLFAETATVQIKTTPNGTLRDNHPPTDYFDALPSFNSPFGNVAPDLPCPCGSGRKFQQCHGASRPR